MYSRVTINGHPIHPMLVAYPISLYTLTFVGFLVYRFSPDPFWFRFAYAANIGGIIMAVIAAIPGFIDWATGIPNGVPAKKDGLTHMSLNVIALVIFIINAVANRGQWNAATPVSKYGLILSIIGLIITGFAGSYGWRLIQTDHVGVLLTPEQQRLEPTQSQAPQGR